MHLVSEHPRLKGPEKSSRSGEMVDKRVVKLHRQALPVRDTLHALELKIYDFTDLFAVECVENDDLIDPVDELRAEIVTKHVQQLRLQFRVVLALGLRGLDVLPDDIGTYIACGYYDGIGER